MRTLTVIDNCEKAVRRFDPNFKVNEIPLEDEKTFNLLASGDTVGVFQFESQGCSHKSCAEGLRGPDSGYFAVQTWSYGFNPHIYKKQTSPGRHNLQAPNA